VSEQDDTPLPLSELAKRLPAVRGTKPPHRATLYKWATKGLKSRSGQCVRLETQFVGGTLCASLADIERFGDNLNDVDYQPTVYRNRREEKRMRLEADRAFAAAIAL
jgi:hypothetical protein